MKRRSTLVLRGVICLTTLTVAVVCLVLVPELAREDAVDHPNSAYMQYLFFSSAYALAVPVFIALYQAFKLVGNIDRNQTFTQNSVQIVKKIKYCAVADSALLLAGLVCIMVLARGEDITGIVILGLIAAFIASIIATFVGVLQQLLQNAVDMKSENDSTV